MRLGEPTVIAPPERATRLAISDDGTRIAAALRYGQAVIVYAADGTVVARHALDYPAGVAFGRRGELYVVWQKDDRFTLSVMDDVRRDLATYDFAAGPERLVRSGDGRFLAVVGRIVEVWDLARVAACARFDPRSERQLAAGFFPGRPWLYLLGTEPDALVLHDLFHGVEVARLPAPRGCDGRIDVSTGGRLLVTSSLDVWDTLAYRDPPRRDDGYACHAAAAGDLVVTLRDGVVTVRRLPDGETVTGASLGWVRTDDAALSLDGTRCVLACAPRSIVTFAIVT